MNAPTLVPYVIFYDGSCGLCRRIRRCLERFGADHPMRFIDVSDREELSRWPQIDPRQAQEEVFVLDPRGHLAGGYDAVLVLMAATVPGLRLASPLLRLSPIRRLGQKAYHWISTHRHRISTHLCEPA